MSEETTPNELKEAITRALKRSSKIVVWVVAVLVVVGFLIALTQGALLRYLALLVLCAGAICGNFLMLGTLAWKDHGTKLIHALFATCWITSGMWILGLGDLGTLGTLGLFMMVPFMFPIWFTISVLAIFEKETLPVTDELAALLVGAYLLWTIQATDSFTHLLFICGAVLFLLYFLFARREQMLGSVMRGVSVFGIVTYLFATFVVHLLDLKQSFGGEGDLSTQLVGHWALAFTVGTVASYVLLYGMRVLEIVVKLTPLRFLTPELRKDTLRASMERLGNAFNPTQYSPVIMAAWIVVMILVLQINTMLGSFVPPLSILVIMIVLATYRPGNLIIPSWTSVTGERPENPAP